MKIKVCGITTEEQMTQLDNLEIPFLGINFYARSSRFYNGDLLSNVVLKNTKKVGVFVNADDKQIDKMISLHGLDYIQLHGDETPAFCGHMASKTKVIKAFPHYNLTEIDLLNKYTSCDFFLFDTASLGYGGSGKKFDWEILKEYKGPKPYLLAGGISEDDVEKIKSLKNLNGFLGIDINSKFENSPGIKNIERITKFIKELKNG